MYPRSVPGCQEVNLRGGGADVITSQPFPQVSLTIDWGNSWPIYVDHPLVR